MEILRLNQHGNSTLQPTKTTISEIIGAALYFYVVVQFVLAFVIWAARSGGVPWEELLAIWRSYSLCALPALCLGIAARRRRTARLYPVGLFLVSGAGLLLPAPLIMQYAKNGSVETARLVAPMYDPAIRKALSCEIDPSVTQVLCHRHSLIVYSPGTFTTWATDKDVRRYNSAADPDWIAGVGDKPEVVAIVTKGRTASTGSFESCLGASCTDAGEVYQTTWAVTFVSLSLNAVVRTEVLNRTDTTTDVGVFWESVDRRSETPPDSGDVTDIIKRVVTWE